MSDCNICDNIPVGAVAEFTPRTQTCVCGASVDVLGGKSGRHLGKVGDHHEFEAWGTPGRCPHCGFVWNYMDVPCGGSYVWDMTSIPVSVERPKTGA